MRTLTSLFGCNKRRVHALGFEIRIFRESDPDKSTMITQMISVSHGKLIVDSFPRHSW